MRTIDIYVTERTLCDRLVALTEWLALHLWGRR